MAKDALAKAGVPLNPAGMNDNVPLEAEPNFYQTRGIASLSERCLQRCNGKQLVAKFDAPILNIHASLKDRIWIETPTALYMFTDRVETPATFVIGDDDSPVLGDDGETITE